MLSAVDTWAALAAFAGAAGLLLRRHMLRPGMGTWCAAPAPVQTVLALTALGLGAIGVSIVYGDHASPREAAGYSLVAGMAWVMVFNLDRNGRVAAERAA
jgi:hypothetical protein